MYIARWYFDAEPPLALPVLIRRDDSTAVPPTRLAVGEAAARKGERPQVPNCGLLAKGELPKDATPGGEVIFLDIDPPSGELCVAIAAPPNG